MQLSVCRELHLLLLSTLKISNVPNITVQCSTDTQGSLNTKNLTTVYNLWGTMFWPLIKQRWPLLRGCFVHKLFIWDLGAWPLYSSWPLFGGGC